MEKFVIIDGSNIFFRAFFALPLLSNFEGEYSNAVFGFTNTLVKIIKSVKPKYIVVALDPGKKTFRHELYKDYKGTRKPIAPELAEQFPILKKLLNAMGIKYIEHTNLEADDIIGCLTRKFNTENIIVTSDKDCLQLINGNTCVMQPQKANLEPIIYDSQAFLTEWGFEPLQLIDYKALRGDPSDNIPGVKGVGDKSAVELVHRYGTLENLYEHIDEIGGKLKEKLITDKENAFLSKKLATIIVDENLDYSLEDFEYDFPFNAEVLSMFKRYQFNSLLKKDDLFDLTKGDMQTTMQNTIKCQQIAVNTTQELNDMLANIPANEDVAIHFETGSFSVAFSDKEYVGSIKQQPMDNGFELASVYASLKEVFESKQLNKVVFDAKALKHRLHQYNISLNNVVFDISVARYVVNTSGKANVNLETVCNENLIGLEYSAFNLLTLKKMYEKKIDELKLHNVFYEIEMPLIDVLFNMEITGFKIDVKELNALEVRFKHELEEITQSIYTMIGEEFNLNSPKKLGEILFDKLGLKAVNNKKKSTGVQVLTEIKDQHPIVDKILQYRRLSKIYTTYILAYKNIVDSQTHKIYTVFNQTLTSTGRLSSSEPNLQNIPIRTEEGRQIRKLFIPSFEGGYIIGADYSQIELRLLANFSGDERLIEAYNKGMDIHALTASEIFGVPINEVTPAQRRDAKAINFGIVYGISDYGLSQNINTSVFRANDYIKRYFLRYPKLETYMKQNVEYCKENGFVKTYFGRIRHIPEIKNSKFTIRQFGERAAMNMPLQGTASDIIKIAMIMVYKQLNKNHLKSKLILQVHDELIVDTHPDDVEQVKTILKECMENVVNLKVKLEVNIEVGKNWFEA